MLSDTDDGLEEKLDLIVDVHRSHSNHTDDTCKVSTKSLQCLVNILINQPNRMKLFVTSNKVAKLCLSLRQYTSESYSDSLLVDLQYIIKILFMIKSW